MILAAIVMMASTSVFAQHEVGSVTLQPRAGVNIANFTKANGADPRIGLAAGAELEYQMNSWVSLAGGVMYSMQGSKEERGGATATLQIDYLNVPIVANFYVLKGLAIKAGIQPGFKVSSKLKASSGGVSITGGLDEIIGKVKGFDLSLPVGLSYEVSNFVIDGRWNVGATKIFEGGDHQHSVVQITLGYKFGL